MILLLVTAFLELLFIFVILSALCHQRERIGVAPLTMAYGTIMCFGTLMCASEVTIPLPGGLEFEVAKVVVFLPLLTAFLMVYITMGVLKAQRLLLGIVCSFLLYLYFGMLIKVQCSVLPRGALRDVVFILLADGTASVNLCAVSNLIAFFTVPVIYSSFPLRLWRTLRIIFSLLLAQALGMIPEVVLAKINGNPGNLLWYNAAVTAGATVFIGWVLSFFLALLEKDNRGEGSGALDFVFAFFGSYGRVKELESDLNSWANRYHQILRHTAEVVVMSDRRGIIQEANIAAGRVFDLAKSEMLIGKNLFAMLKNIEPADTDLAAAEDEPLYFNCRIDTPAGEKILSASLSPIRSRKHLLLVLVARDITEEVTLAREKDELAEQLMHSQRMESLGMLAGGIAHDFNNCIHAIMGHADVAGMLYTGDPEKVASHLKKISSIAEKAGKLTSQLLGFARKGKYNVVDIDLVKLLDECTGLLDPFRTRGVEITTAYPKHKKLLIRGDLVQMQQVVLNLLINALDATADNPDSRRIVLSAGSADDAPLKFAPSPDYAKEDGEYLYFAVKDNGSGMDEATRKKVFEPFFTTKPVGSGTGMGLAMVYGTVSHHKGWIQLQSEPGKGTTFCFFFPAVTPSVLNDDR